MLAHGRLKKKYMLVLEPCPLEDVENDVEEGDDPY